jgi:hypothetical protein
MKAFILLSSVSIFGCGNSEKKFDIEAIKACETNFAKILGDSSTVDASLVTKLQVAFGELQGKSKEACLEGAITQSYEDKKLWKVAYGKESDDGEGDEYETLFDERAKDPNNKKQKITQLAEKLSAKLFA